MKQMDMSLTAFKYGESVLPSSAAFDGDHSHREIPIGWLFYFIRYGERNILIDTGCSDIGKFAQFGFRLTQFIEPLKLLEDYGLTPDAITDIIITHADFDHIGDINYYPKADIYIQENEFLRYKDHILVQKKVKIFKETLRILEKFVITRIGGHREGSSIITFHHGAEEYVLGGDECYLAASLKDRIPTGISCNINRSRWFVERYSDRFRMVLFCHDPDVVKGSLGYSEIIKKSPN